MGLWLDPVTVGNSLKVIVPWAIRALNKLPDFACPATVKAQLMYWLNWADALSTDAVALQGVANAINTATQGAATNTVTPVHPTSWSDVALALINNIPAILGAIGAICAAYWAYQSKKQGVVNHEAMNSRLDQVVVAKEEIAHAAGMAKQKLDAADEKAAVEKRLNEIRGESQA